MSKSKGNTVEPWQVLDTLRRRRLPLVLLHLQAAVGRLPLLGGDDRRGRAPVPQAAVVDLLLLRALRARRRRAAGEAPRPSAERERGAADDLDRWALSRTAAHGRARRRAPRRLRRDDAPGARSRRSSTSCRTGTCAARDGASGTATRRRSQTLRTCLLTVAKLLAPFCPFIADEIYDNLDGALASVHLCDFPAARSSPPRDEELERGDGARARDGAPRAGRARQGEDQGAPAAGRGGRRRRRARARGDRTAGRRRARGAERARACASSRRPRSSAATR